MPIRHPIDNARKIGPHGVADKAVDDALDRAGGALDCELGLSFGGKTIGDLAAAEGRATAPGTAVRYGLFIKLDEAS